MPPPPSPARDALVALAIVGAATAVGLLARGGFNVADHALLLLLAVVLASTRVGRLGSAVAVIVGVAALDLFFVEPYLTFAVADLHHIVTFAVFVVVGAVVSDLTRRVHAQATTAEQLLAANRAAEQARLVLEAERTRTSLLSAVSHDLRTPLGAITGAATALLEGDRHTAPEREALLRTVRDESVRLGRLIGGILDLTRLEAGPEPKKEWVPIDEVVLGAVDRLQAQVASREVRVQLPEEVVLIPMDPVLIDQLLFNLLDNAAKYAPDGPVEVEARRDPAGIRVEVRDRGVGLPPGAEARVFERFWRAPDGGRAGGSGLGLAIAAAIARIHAGAVYAHNRAGGGAVFGFTLPIAGVPPTVPEELP